jgi:hypothetical protein
MTKKEGKELSLEVWRYFEEHPEIKSNKQLPYYLYRKAKGLLAESPLCEVILMLSWGVLAVRCVRVVLIITIWNTLMIAGPVRQTSGIGRRLPGKLFV